MTAGSAFRPRDAALLVVLALLWGNSFLFIKLAVVAVSPIWLVTIRMALGALLLLAVAAALRLGVPRGASMLATLSFIGIVGCALPWLGQAWAQQYLDSGLVAVLNACTPVATLVIAVLTGQERLYRNRVTGLALAILGTVVVIHGEVGAGRSVLALLTAVFATAGYALGAVATRARVSGRVPNIVAAATQLCFGTAALGPIAWIGAGPPPARLDHIAAGSLLVLGLLGTGLAFLIFLTLIENVGATNTTMVTYLIPVVGLISGAVWRGERFGANVFAGAVALIAGVWLAQRQPRAKGVSPA